jgi:hypothetical protein
VCLRVYLPYVSSRAVEGESEKERVLPPNVIDVFNQAIDNIVPSSFLPGFGSRYASPILEDI